MRDPGLPGKLARKPMVELTAGSNVWYQGQVIKESANEVKIAYGIPCECERATRLEHWGGGIGGPSRRACTNKNTVRGLRWLARPPPLLSRPLSDFLPV